MGKPNASTTLAILVGLGLPHAMNFPLKTCDVCGKAIESGTSYREVAGIGRFHPECDPREKGTAK